MLPWSFVSLFFSFGIDLSLLAFPCQTGVQDLGEIARAKSDFDAVGHNCWPNMLNLHVNDHRLSPVTFTSTANDQN